MSRKREQFISDEDKELEHIRVKKLQELMKVQKEKEKCQQNQYT
ncbi:MAG: hypothetical protein QXJ11_06330 [Candidatus Bathyarchaeia archaeon]